MATILLIDDEPAVLEGLSLVLRKQPYRLFTATSAANALTVMENNEVDVIVSDECMPGMSGTEFLALACQRWPNTQRIVLTGHASTQAAVRAVNQSKAFYFLHKPCEPKDLIAALEAAIQHRQKAIKSIFLLAEVQSHLRAMSGEVTFEPTEIAPTKLRLSSDEYAQLTRREIEILNLLVAGQRIANVAKTLFLSAHTVRNHLKAVFKKLDVHSQEALVRKVAPRN